MIVDGRYFIEDVETGDFYEVSKELYDRYKTAMKFLFNPELTKIEGGYKGAMIIIGPGGGFSQGENRNFFYAPEGYKFAEILPGSGSSISFFKPKNIENDKTT